MVKRYTCLHFQRENQLFEYRIHCVTLALTKFQVKIFQATSSNSLESISAPGSASSRKKIPIQIRIQLSAYYISKPPLLTKFQGRISSLSWFADKVDFFFAGHIAGTGVKLHVMSATLRYSTGRPPLLANCVVHLRSTCDKETGQFALRLVRSLAVAALL